MSEKWMAEVIVSGGNSDGWEHYVVRVIADNSEAALDGTRSVAEHMTAGYHHRFRKEPYVVIERSHETGKMLHLGRSRFSIKPDISDDAIEQTEIKIPGA